MKLKWLGHASFLITSESGTKIVTDPYIPGGDLKYGEIEESADIVTVSHDHFDHNNVAAVQGNPTVVKGTAEVMGIKFNSLPTYHDDAQGAKRSSNTIIYFELDGVNVCHLGDLGHTLSNSQTTSLGKVDILLVPVGGFYTIDARAASQVCDQIKPRVIIPMHFKNEKCDFPISGVDEFLQGKANVSRPETSEVEFKAGELPGSTQITQIIVVNPAM